MMNPFKVIINNRNRLSTTKNMVDFLFKIAPNSRIIILDNESTYPPLLEWYKEIKDRVDVRFLENLGHLALWKSGVINEIEEEWLFYTDSDIELNPNMSPHYQKIMLLIAKKYKINKVGLALSIDDIPDHYKFKETVIKNESGWWKEEVEDEIYKAHTDTTFALIKKGPEQYESLRIAGNFTCKHTPWYLNLNLLNDEEKYYLRNTATSRLATQYTKMHNTSVLPKVSCVMTTYRRFTCVQRSLSMFLYQDYEGPIEFILFNTDEENPYVLGPEFDSIKDNIKIVNNNIDYITKIAYTNVGAIRRDALTHASGELYICWDDDDIFLPWNVKMCVEGYLEKGQKAWKPIKSFFATPNNIKLAQNVMEASLIVNIEEVRKYGFLLENGKEHLSWYTALRDEKQLDENNTDSIPGYCFNWGDVGDIAAHKQSGDIDNPDNFNNHKEKTNDYAKTPVRVLSQKEMRQIWKPYLDWFLNHTGDYNEIYYNRYVKIYQEEDTNLVFLSAQPSGIYFQWQTEVQIVNFRKHGISKKMHVVVWRRKNSHGEFKHWLKLKTKYPEVSFFIYEDTGADLNLYLSNIRANALKQHFRDNKEMLKDRSIFYHDSDVIFNRLPNFNKLMEDKIVWQSNTSSYLDFNYLLDKEAQGNMPLGESINKMAEIGGISPFTIRKYAGKTGGAQILLKEDIDEKFWEDVERMGYKIRYEFVHSDERDVNPNSINNRYFKAANGLNGEQNGFQSWCADMWAINFALWKRGIETNISAELDFSWGSDSIETYYKKPIFHNAGVTRTQDGIFYKGDWRNKSPIGEVLKADEKRASSKYIEAIREVNK